MRLNVFETVLFLPSSRTVKCVCHDRPIPNCGARYLVKLSNYLTDVHINYNIASEESGSFKKRNYILM